MKYEINYDYIADCLNEDFEKYEIHAVAGHDYSKRIYLYQREDLKTKFDCNSKENNKHIFAWINVEDSEITITKEPIGETKEDLAFIFEEVYGIIDETFPDRLWKHLWCAFD